MGRGKVNCYEAMLLEDLDLTVILGPVQGKKSKKIPSFWPLELDK